MKNRVSARSATAGGSAAWQVRNNYWGQNLNGGYTRTFTAPARSKKHGKKKGRR